ncbi:adenosylcobinamide-phosphate synthase CbiB [Undibacterium sp. SXout7W]|uniref:adenosylcobinamide-phosphate synthase CbiB n=1 Tax=Undibacterium sp. SXout7W TaxID=3413049 RepID=UPI003BF2663E
MLSGFTLALCLVLGVALDMALGEAKHWHPLVGFGRYAGMIERVTNHPASTRWRGAVAWILAVIPIVIAIQSALLLATYLSTWLAPVLHGVLLYVCLGLRSLRDHNLPIQQTLDAGDLSTARQLTSRIVSRDTADADEAGLAKASVESLLENGCDAVFGTLFWFILFGGAGAVLYRLVNTLDAMWGYRTPKWIRFGCVAARADDVLGWIPARLTAITYALLGHTRRALNCWRIQAPAWPSPNAGPVMSAGAGALGIILGGSARYDGVDELRPVLGSGTPVVVADITRAWRLVLYGALLWCGIVILGTIFLSGVLYA